MDMARRLFAVGLAAGAVCLAQIEDAGQSTPGEPPLSAPSPNSEGRDRMPNGKSRSNAMAEEQHKKAMEEADELVRMAEDLRRQIADAGKFVVPMSAIHKTEDIEKLAKKIRGRLQN
ncbi:MAG TPA: hypothetical protein VFE47_15965 [Tepidisphaeraceae bacterium]|nr:hypothetical protein [Tepidisphaeraceae bacterium]